VGAEGVNGFGGHIHKTDLQYYRFGSPCLAWLDTQAERLDVERIQKGAAHIKLVED
jgi:hypothetical protein